MLRIRFKRAGRKNRPVFFLVAAQNTDRRDSGCSEKLCTFERFAGYEKGVFITEQQKERINFLLAHGAQLTESSFFFLKRINIGIAIPKKISEKFESVRQYRIDNNIKKPSKSKK